MKRVAIIDYGMCNLDSIARAVEECGADPVVTDAPRTITRAEAIILPGVGAFADAMSNIRKLRLDRVMAEKVIGEQVPFLGICLGMQLLATKGWEGGETEGLAWLDGEVRRLEPAGEDTRIPHMGWNEVYPARESPLFAGIEPGKDFYFLHSFHLCLQHDRDSLATTPYCNGFVSAVNRGSIFGVQFHPEKSQRVGFQLLRNFLSL